MAWIVNATKTPPTVAATSFTPLLGAHVANDLLLVFLAQDGGALCIGNVLWSAELFRLKD